MKMVCLDCEHEFTYYDDEECPRCGSYRTVQRFDGNPMPRF